MALTDHDLITAYLNGDDRSFEILVDRYQHSLYYTVRSIIFDGEEAKEITQRAFVRAFNNLKRLKNKKNFRSWLFRIAINLTRDHIRKRKTHHSIKSWMTNGNNPTDMPEQAMLASEIKHYIKLALDSLPPRQRQVVTLRLLKGFSFKEIANLLEIKEESARSSFHFGIKRLKKQLSEMGIVP